VRIALVVAEWRMILSAADVPLQLLRDVKARFSEGFATRDFRHAASLLRRLEPTPGIV
jgi:hypothetical protein